MIFLQSFLQENSLPQNFPQNLYGKRDFKTYPKKNPNVPYILRVKISTEFSAGKCGRKIGSWRRRPPCKGLQHFNAVFFTWTHSHTCAFIMHAPIFVPPARVARWFILRPKIPHLGIFGMENVCIL
jgi:hypothetical protein